MWSIGVILYVLLSGSMPFEDRSLYEDIEHARYSFEGARWEGVSEIAKDMINKLLMAEPEARLTVEQSLQHEWLADLDQEASNGETPMQISAHRSNTASSAYTDTSGSPVTVVTDEEDSARVIDTSMPPPPPRHQKRSSDDDVQTPAAATAAPEAAQDTSRSKRRKQ